MGHLKTKIEWVVLAIFGAIIALLIKLWTDSSKLKDAVEFGYKKKTEELATDSTYKKMQIEFNALNNKVDSLTKIIKIQSETKQKSNGK